METALLSRGWMLALGAALSAVVALAAVRARALTRDGAAAAILVGTLIVGFAGFAGGMLLVAFFIMASSLTRWGAQHKPHPEHGTGRRASQVIANGAVAAAMSVWWGLTGSPLAAAGIAGAIAAASADTLATEVGLLSPSPPRLIITGRPVPPGTSGAVSWLGTVAGVFGAMMIALGGLTFLDVHATGILLAGVLGMAVDSVLGATVEGRAGWLNNDVVNLLGTLTGGLVCAAFITLVPPGANGGTLLLMLPALLSLSLPVTMVWTIRKEGGLGPMWRSLDRPVRAVFVTVVVRYAGFGLLGLALLVAALAEVWLGYLFIAGLVLGVLSSWPFRLLIARWIK